MKILQEEKIKKTRIFWVSGIIIIVLILLAVCGFFIMRMVRERQYTQLIEKAENYAAAKDYEEAAVTYRSAIKVNEKEYRGYEGLSEVYIVQQQYSMARAVLEEGLDKTESRTLQYIYTKIEKAVDGTELEQIQSGLDAAAGENPWNDSLLTYIGNASYKQYASDYKNGTIHILDNGCSVFYEQLGATLYFLKEGNTAVINGETGEPFDGQVPSYVVFNDLSGVFFSYENGFGPEDIQKVIQYEPEIKQSGSRYYLEFEYLNCLFQIDCDADGYVADMKNANKIFPLAQSLSEDMAEITVTVVDATTGDVLEDVTVNARSGSGSEEGDAVTSAVSDANGEINLQVPSDTYTLEYMKDGYVTEYEEVTVSSQTRENLGTKVMSPNLAEGEWRIVLEWGDNPADLDSHLVSDAYHISYYSPAAGQMASLDVDDTDGQGPETITITSLDASDHYEYYVHDFTNSGNANSSALANSGATVKVYMPNGEIREYSVPGGNGTIWSVFTIDNGQIHDVNQIQAE